MVEGVDPLIQEARKYKSAKEFVKAQKGDKLGTCVDENLVSDIFGSVTDFAQEIEKRGTDNFLYGNINVRYNPKTDTHTFYKVDKSQLTDIWNKAQLYKAFRELVTD